MGLMDILQGQGAKDVTGERQSSTTPKGRIADSIQRQINVAEGKTEKVAGQEVKPWYDDELGGMRIKVGGFTLRTITMPKEIPKATCHRGMVGGSVSGNNKPLTKKPSLISCFLTIANKTSQKPPTT